MKKRPTPHEKPSALEPRRNDNPSDLFPDTLPAATPAIWPTEGTRKADALEALIAGPQNQCDYRPGWRLAADGWAIQSREIAWHGKTIAEYCLDLGDEPTRAAVAAVRRGGQAGFVRPDLVGLVAVAAPAIVVLLAAFFGGA